MEPIPILPRTEPAMLADRMAVIAREPIVGALMQLLSGVVLVLDENRQIVGANPDALERLGVTGTEELLGMRPGEVFHCRYAMGHPEGCGNTEYCATCGAALAIVGGLVPGGQAVRFCALTRQRPGGDDNFLFRVTGKHMPVGGRVFVLVLFEDMTINQLWSTMHKGFLHDLKNTVTALLGTVELMEGSGDEDLQREAGVLVRRLTKEIEVHRSLIGDLKAPLRSDRREFSLGTLASELETRVRHFHDRQGREDLLLAGGTEGVSICSDYTLLMRVLFNMVSNAMEATRPGQKVTLSARQEDHTTIISVHNPGVIPETVQWRVFQLHFSTKGDIGRGKGTASMKLIGERFLGGQVWFTSLPGEGTVFSISLPHSSELQENQ